MPDPKDAEFIKHHKPFHDEETEKRIHDHIFNANDEITEDDIAHVRTSFEGDKAPQTYIPTSDEEEEQDKRDAAESLRPEQNPGDEEMSDNTDPNVGSVWNIKEGN